MKRAIIFDFDGTIADSFEYVLGFLQAEAKNGQHYTAAEKTKLRQMSMKRLALHLGVPVWRLPALYFKGRRVMRAHMEHVKAFPGAAEMLKQLHADGYLLFIASANSGKNMRLFLERYELRQYFKGVRGGSGFAGKAALLRRILVQYRLTKAQTWYVGDETIDVVAAAAAGLRCIAVGWGFANADSLKQMEPTGFAALMADIPKIIRKDT